MLRSAVFAWLRLSRIFQKVGRASDVHLRGWGLSTAQFDILAQVGAAKGITQQELADRLLVTKGNVSQLLDRMEKQGLLTRSQERRSNSLSLTDKGQELYDRVVPAQEELVARQFRGLTPAEVSELLVLLRKLDHALD
ncbi:MarR family winged helix-turn-helix transcriptional regulator [Dictyobacter kobayashii]|uniref:MarR family transcriptional regulator n=1 Tax=Dictyobacter kobayashii TaxID=2014872 RepID=A0A402ARI2_9CHLR|nr:MarR family transcriptional regulator [Dictyobacter kobayashii]GCE21704.1 MarR family transcriptional regulator [Dictyobacter kobayashii]